MLLSVLHFNKTHAQLTNQTIEVNKILSLPDSKKKFDTLLTVFYSELNNNVDTLKIKSLINIIVNTAKNLNSNLQPAKAYVIWHTYYLHNNNFILAERMLDSAYFKLGQDTISIENKNFLTLLNYFKANIFIKRGQTDDAIQLLLRCLNDYVKSNAHPNNILSTYSSISTVFQMTEQYDKSKFYIDKAIDFYNGTHFKNPLFNDSALLFDLYIRNALNYSQLQLIDSAHSYLAKTAMLFNSNSSTFDTASFYKTTGLVYANERNYNMALKFYLKSISFFKKLKPLLDYIDCLGWAGKCQYELGNYEAALKMYQEQRDVSTKMNNNQFLSLSYRQLGIVYSKLQLYENAYNYYDLYLKLRDSIDQNALNEKVNAIENKFNYKQKEQENKALEQRNKITELQLKQRNLLLYLFSGVVIIFTLLSFSWWKSHKRQKELIARELEIEQQKHLTLEKEKELSAAQATLKGQEEERTRIARDLHDGLGGMLSAIKLTLTSIEKKIHFNTPTENHYKKVLDQFDYAINEMRRISYNMMPEALIKYGLKKSLEDYCAKMSNNNFKVIFQCYGIEERWEQMKEITVYRIVQELVNNAIKHSGASQCLIQIVKESNKVILTAEDNGKGFNFEDISFKRGLGLQNIQSRVNLINGQMQIKSDKETGSIFNIEFNT